jgi:hypothetical protein
MEYVLTGFRQDNNIRRYTFQGIELDWTRTEFTVDVDLGLIRKYEIPVQELPLLCRHLLQRQTAVEPRHMLTFTEEDMHGHARARLAEQQAAEQRKTQRRVRLGEG